MPGLTQRALPLAALLLLSLMWPIARQSYAQTSAANPTAVSKTSGSSGAKKLSNGLGGQPADASTEITTVGCLKGGTDAFFDDSGGYTLTGNDDVLNEYGDDWVRIRGRITEDAPQNLEVISITKVFGTPDAVLDPQLRNPSRWQSYSNQTLGVRFALPKEFIPATEHNEGLMLGLRPGFIKNENVTDLDRSVIPREIYLPQKYPLKELTSLQSENPPLTDFSGGAFGLFVNPRIIDPLSCKQFDADLKDGDISSRTINRINYTVNSNVWIPPLAYDSFHTFQNGRCFEVDFAMGEIRYGPVDISCAIESADDTALETLVLSKISFFRPKPAAAGPGASSLRGLTPNL